VDEYLTEAELAALLKVTRRTVKRWRAEGGGPPWVRIGRGIRYRRRDVDAWAERQPGGGERGS
jgi:excisionase family DNA binding protein